MYHLIGTPVTRTIRVAWMLEELGQPYDWEPAPPHADRVKDVSGAPKVPVLITQDVAITDSVAIMTYLADRHAALTESPGTVERARQDALTQFCVDELDNVLWVAAKHKFALPKALRVAEVRASCEAEWKMSLSRLAARLGDGPYLMGRMFTLPDIIAAHCIGWAKSVKFDLPEGPITEYRARCTARPAYRAALARGKSLTEG